MGGLDCEDTRQILVCFQMGVSLLQVLVMVCIYVM